MFEKLKQRMIKQFYVVQDHGDQISWQPEEEVLRPDFARVDDYIANNGTLGQLGGVVFCTQKSAIRLSFKYNIYPHNISGMYHHRVFINPPVDLLKILYEHIPDAVVDFVKACYKNYAMGELSYMDATWIMAIILGKRD